MGPAHAASGLAVGALTLPLAANVGVDVPLEQIGYVVACGGFAYLPDLDQEGSTAGSMWGAPTRLLAAGIGVLARRHRGGTHDLVVAPLAFGLLVGLASRATWSAVLVLALAIGLALHAVGQLVPGDLEKTALGNALVSLAGAWWLIAHGYGTIDWLPLAAGLGVVAHIAGDWLTTGGVPVPFTTWLSRRPVTVGLRAFRAGRGPEPLLRRLVFPALTLLGLYLHVEALHELVHPAVEVVGGALRGLAA